MLAHINPHRPAAGGREFDAHVAFTRTEQRDIAFAYWCFVPAAAALGRVSGLAAGLAVKSEQRAAVSTATAASPGAATLSPNVPPCVVGLPARVDF